MTPKAKVDRLWVVRQTKHDLEREDKELTNSLKSYMEPRAISELIGRTAMVKLSGRDSLVIQPDALIQEVGLEVALPCLSVGIEKAREHLPGLVLTRLGTLIHTPVLYVAERARARR